MVKQYYNKSFLIKNIFFILSIKQYQIYFNSLLCEQHSLQHNIIFRRECDFILFAFKNLLDFGGILKRLELFVLELVDNIRTNPKERQHVDDKSIKLTRRQKEALASTKTYAGLLRH